jgi:hypothetical protein
VKELGLHAVDRRDIGHRADHSYRLSRVVANDEPAVDEVRVRTVAALEPIVI